MAKGYAIPALASLGLGGTGLCYRGRVCGIAGFCDFSKRSSESALRRMAQVLHHRGPDDAGSFLHQTPSAQIGLAHRRLSIIDLSAQGHQPMATEDGRFHLVFNGEIYNFAEVRDELEGLGERFRSTSDTEVVLRAFGRWGTDCVHRFIGMFAFAILDAREQKLHLFRDRAGVKPLYYFWNGRLLLFASELKALHEHPDFPRELHREIVPTYLSYGFIPAPHTIFRETYKLRPGHFLELDLRRGQLAETEYWSVLDAYNAPKLELSDEDAASELETILDSAFRYRLVADVPVGLFLSGGYDSSAVAALLQRNAPSPLRTFTIGFEGDGYDEAPYARRVAEHLGTRHTEHYFARRDAAAILPRLPEIYDEPYGDWSAIPTVLVSQLARREVKVALSADGGDESFAGYLRYTQNLDFYRRLASLPAPLRRALRPLLRPLSKLPPLRGSHNVDGRIDVLERLLGESEARRLYRHKIEFHFYSDAELSNLLVDRPSILPSSYDHFRRIDDDNDDINRMLAVDYQTYLVDDILTKVDRATMSVGLEGREPLLDHRIIEFAARLPGHHKFRDGVQKVVLKNLVHRHLPKELMDRPKMGFELPPRLFAGEIRELLGDYLTEDRLSKGGIFEPRSVVALRDRVLRGEAVQFEKYWLPLSFEMWRARWL